MNNLTSQPRLLLILDLDETLVHSFEPLTSDNRAFDFTFASYAVIKRPFVDHFLLSVAQWFDLAVWTASSHDYAQAIVASLFPNPQQLQFVWSRQHTTLHFPLDGRTPFQRKNLNKVKRRLGFSLERMLMIDDSPEKLEQHYGNLITVKPFEGDGEDRELLDLLRYLEQLQTVANVRTIEKRFWRKTR